VASDAIIQSARATLEQSLQDLRASLEGAPDQALNWQPAGAGSNSLAVLAVHTMHSTRSWLCSALGVERPARDRDAEFRASAGKLDEVLRVVDEFGADCRKLLDGASEPVDWSAPRETHARPNSGDPTHVPAAWALIHALEHLREHVGQIQLTRQLWDARA
jgi:uncharacterized damage-inducible protein DinB